MAGMGSVRRTSFRGRSFITRDGSLETWLALVADALARRDGPTWWRPMARDFGEQAVIVFDGLLETRLDDHAVDEDRRQALRDLFAELRAEHATRGLEPGAARCRIVEPACDEAVLRVADAILWLLDTSPEAHLPAGGSQYL